MTIDDAKTSFDFTLNSSVLSATLSLAMLLVGLRYLSFQASPTIWLPWLLKVFVFAVMAYWFYFLTIGRAKNWGIMFKGAFDLYRLELLKRLGYTRKPATLAMERFLWNDIFQQLVFGDSPAIPLAQFDLKTVFAMPKLDQGMPSGGHMETARGISVASNNGSVVVTLKIKNVDTRGRKAQAVVVMDTIPEGFAYQWNSAWRFNSADQIEVLGTNPMQFQIGDVLHGQTALVHYRIAPMKSI
ncbi:MAG: hypothetical protein JO360_04370 [Acidobacteria bacterium]|nr:hypothetical protein [Acidobacteriota bacterium]